MLRISLYPTPLRYALPLRKRGQRANMEYVNP